MPIHKIIERIAAVFALPVYLWKTVELFGIPVDALAESRGNG